MDEAPWIGEARRQRSWDRWLARRPVCPDCGEPIREERALPLDGELICPDCVLRRMIPVEE